MVVDKSIDDHRFYFRNLSNFFFFRVKMDYDREFKYLDHANNLCIS